MGLTIAGLKKERLKTVLVILSIAIAVAVSISIIVSISSIKDAYYRMADEMSSSADLILTSKNEVDINEENESFGDVSEISVVIPFYSKEAYFTKDDQTSIFMYLAVDIGNEQKYGKLNLLDGSLDLQPEECAVTTGVSDQYNLKIGDRIEIVVNRQLKTMRVAGIVDDKGVCSENLGRCVITDISTYEGKGNKIYKLILSSDSDTEKVKGLLENSYRLKYDVAYPDGKTLEFLQGINTLFYGMAAMALLVIIISSVFLKNVIHDYVVSMKSNFSTIKVLGGTGKTIMKLVLEKMTILSALGIMLGILLSIGFVRVMVPFIGQRLDSGNNEIIIVWKYPIVIAVILFVFIYSTLISLPSVIASAKSPILLGFRKNLKEDISIRNWVLGIGFILVTVALRFTESNENLRYIVELVLIFEFVVLITKLVFPILCKFLNYIMSKCIPFTCLISKGTLVSHKTKTGNMVVLFSVVLAFSIGIFSAVDGVVQSIRNVSDTIYYGNVIVESDYGITDELIAEVESVNGVEKVENNYTKTTEIEGWDVKVRGIYKDNTNFKLSEQTMNELFDQKGVVVSEGFLDKTGLKIGDTIIIQNKAYSILDTFKSMEHDGKMVLLSADSFLTAFNDYELYTLIVYKNDNTDMETLIKNIKDIDYQTSFFVKSIDDAKEEYVSSNSGILKLFYALIFILFISASLIIINSTSLVIEGNRYSQRIEKTLGVGNYRFVKSYMLTGFIIGVSAGVIGIVAGRFVGRTLCNMLNQTHIYSVKYDIEPYQMIIMFIFTTILVMISSTISTIINLKRGFSLSLVED